MLAICNQNLNIHAGRGAKVNIVKFSEYHTHTLTVHERSVYDILGLFQESLPSVFHQLSNLPPGFKVQADLPVVEGGPVATAGKEKAENEDDNKEPM